MNNQLGFPELIDGLDIEKDYPSMISLDMTLPLRQLNMYTNNLVKLSAPAELSIMKAIELISDRDNYELNFSVFKMELLEESIDTAWIVDVNSLVAGIRCVADYLIATMFEYTGKSHRFFPYQYHGLFSEKQLLLTLINVNATLPLYTAPSLPKPAYMYSQLQESSAESNTAPLRFEMHF